LKKPWNSRQIGTGLSEEACGEDRELQSEVQRMLIPDAQLESPIDLPAASGQSWYRIRPIWKGRPLGAAESMEPAETARFGFGSSFSQGAFWRFAKPSNEAIDSFARKQGRCHSFGSQTIHPDMRRL
jgi:hypothetical protein